MLSAGVSLAACGADTAASHVCGVKISTIAAYVGTTNLSADTKMPTKAQPHGRLNNCEIYRGKEKIGGVTIGSFPGSGLTANAASAIGSRRQLAQHCPRQLSITRTRKSETEVCGRGPFYTVVVLVTKDLDITIDLHRHGSSISSPRARAIAESVVDYWNGR